jgi:hypothetical protein
MTAGEEPRDYVDYPYIEWYSDANGRVVLELERSQLAILTDSPAFEVRRLDRGKQAQNMRRFVTGILKETGAQLGAVVKSKRKTGER